VLRGPAIAFETAVPARIRADERFQMALGHAETARSLEEAMALHRAEAKEWADKGLTLLRAVKAAEDAYDEEVSAAFAAYRKSVSRNEETPNGV
jgi:hypothetical protein